MSDAKKCDNCGKYYDGISHSVSSNSDNNVKVSVAGEIVHFYLGWNSHKDMCGTCIVMAAGMLQTELERKYGNPKSK